MIRHSNLKKENKYMPVVFFHNDMDGHCSGYIAYRALMEKKEKEDLTEQVFMHPINYGWKIDFDLINRGQDVYFLDFIPNDNKVLERLSKENNLIVIDHHKKAIEEFDKNFPGTKGIRNTDHAGCYLTWQYFYPDTDIPKVVQLVSAYDAWQHDSMPNVRELDKGLRTLDLFPIISNNRKIWDRLFNDSNYLDNIIQIGKPILDKEKADYAREASFKCQPIMFEGKRTLLANVQGVDSYFFESVLDEHDPEILIFYYRYFNNRRNQSHWKVSLRSAPKYNDKTGVDEIARKFGGGGHPNASSFQVKTVKDLPFIDSL